MIHVFVAASNPAMRAGLRALLGSDEQLEVVGEAVSLSGLDVLPAEADVVILAALRETGAAVREGMLELLGEKETYPAVLFIGDTPQAAAEISELPLRAWGILSAETGAAELSAAVHALHEGLITASPHLLSPLLRKPQLVRLGPEDNGDGSLGETLTKREIEVLQLLAQGLANKQIAAALNISDHTVKFHVSSIYSKLGAANRTEAVRIGAREGLILF